MGVHGFDCGLMDRVVAFWINYLPVVDYSQAGILYGIAKHINSRAMG